MKITAKDFEGFSKEQKRRVVRMIVAFDSHNSLSKELIIAAFKWHAHNSEWTSVEVDTPPYGDTVLAIDQDGQIQFAWMDEVSFFTKDFLYWMPLPAPPQIEEEL